jgi:ribosomal protein S18 acetylase RimI-like enzyme
VARHSSHPTQKSDEPPVHFGHPGAMTPELLIRAADRSDLDAVAQVAKSRDRAEVRLRAAERHGETMFVAVAGEAVLGIASIRWQNGCDSPHPWLYGLAVAASARRRGVGRALVEACEATTRARGVEALSLDVDLDNDRAIAFYQVLGYTTVRGHEHHWQSLDPRTGAVTEKGTAATWIMRRQLRP